MEIPMPQLLVNVDLPQEVIDSYQAAGPLHRVIAERLKTAVDFTSKKPLYVSDKLRQRLDRLFGRNFASAEELVHAMERAITIRVGEVDVPLQPLLLTRLRTRCFGKPFEQFLAERIVQGLEEYVGMR